MNSAVILMFRPLFEHAFDPEKQSFDKISPVKLHSKKNKTHLVDYYFFRQLILPLYKSSMMAHCTIIASGVSVFNLNSNYLLETI